jgi:hypothetical protein
VSRAAFAVLALIVFASIAWAQGDARPERRLALVIGNGAYATSPLRNPTNDARALTAALKGLGFDVTAHENLGQREMRRAILDFGTRLREGGIGLFYFAGHGVQVNGRNYLVPVDAAIASEAEVEVEAVDVASVLARMETARNRVNLVILDACRDNPFARSFRSAARGLAAIDAPAGTLIAYATAPGRVARDGEGANGLYTGELLKALQAPGQRVEDVFKRVRQAVVERSGGDQVPWESSSLVGEFLFTDRARPAASAGLAGTTWQGTTSEGEAMEIVFEAEGRLRYTALGRQRNESDGGWDQKGAVVVFDVNRYSEWSGVIRGDTIEGSASNRRGARWTWKLLRAP